MPVSKLDALYQQLDYLVRQGTDLDIIYAIKDKIDYLNSL